MSTVKTHKCQFCKTWSIRSTERNWKHRLGGHLSHCRFTKVRNNQAAVLNAWQYKDGASSSSSVRGADDFRADQELRMENLSSSPPPLYWTDYEFNGIIDNAMSETIDEDIVSEQSLSLPAVPADEETYLSQPFIFNEHTNEFCKSALAESTTTTGECDDTPYGDVNPRVKEYYAEQREKLGGHKYYDFQQHLVEWKSLDKWESSFGWIRGCDGSMRKASARTFCLLNEVFVENDLSVRGGDRVLQAFREILEDAGVATNVVLPKSAKSIKQAIVRSCPDGLDPKRFSCKITDILGFGDFRGEAVGWHFDVMNVIADELLNLNDYDIHLEPVNEPEPTRDENQYHHCLKSSFASGLVFEELSFHVKTDYGQSAVCLPIAVSVDDTAFGGLRNRSSAPVYIKILTVKEPFCWQEERIRLVGFCPRLNVR